MALDAVVAATNSALEAADKHVEAEITKVTGGVKSPACTLDCVAPPRRSPAPRSSRTVGRAGFRARRGCPAARRASSSCSRGCRASARRRRSASPCFLRDRRRGRRARLGGELAELRDHVRPCERCGNIAECRAAAPGTRRARSARTTGATRALLCVVARVQDLLAIERSGAMRGRYFVLGRLLSPLEGVGAEELPSRRSGARARSARQPVTRGARRDAAVASTARRPRSSRAGARRAGRRA